MKMTITDYQELKKAIDQAIENNPQALELYRKNNLSNMRYRWDLFHSVNTNLNNFYYSRKLSEYLTDNMIDTALRKITNIK